jgi:hypothetical protein
MPLHPDTVQFVKNNTKYNKAQRTNDCRYQSRVYLNSIVSSDPNGEFLQANRMWHELTRILQPEDETEPGGDAVTELHCTQERVFSSK